MNYRGRRFLIDRIDYKLGSKEKELKFDKIAIAVGIILVVSSAIVLIISATSHPLIAAFALLLLLFGIFLTIAMLREYRSDIKE